MKKLQILVISIFLLLSNLAFGQIEKPKPKTKWTIGVILINEWNWYNYLGGPHVSQNYFDGITVKKHFEGFSARVGIEYITINSVTGKRMDFGSGMNGYLNEGIIRLGIEKGFTIKNRVRPYIALDLAGLRSYSDLISESKGTFVSISKRQISNSFGYGLMPAIGFEYKFTKSVSLSFETRARFLFYRVTTKTSDANDGTEWDHQKNKDFSITINRIGGLTLNVRF